MPYSACDRDTPHLPFIVVAVQYLIRISSISIAFMMIVSSAAAETSPVLLQLIRNDIVQTEIKVSAAQKQKLMDVLVEIDPLWFRARNLSGDAHTDRLQELTNQTRRELERFLKPFQVKRLTELERQAIGTRMLQIPDVVRAMKFTSKQQDVFDDLFSNAESAAAAVHAKLEAGEISNAAADRMLGGLKHKERIAVNGQLSQQQKNSIKRLIGKPFDLNSIRHRYPLGPDFQVEGATWLQGGPLTMESLRGKVVAVHFYAFQCINCRRNLPHYKSWYQDFADDGLVVIGIQTPETSAEHSIDQVRSAAKKDGITYPVLFDAELSNWRHWGNNVWPTVYLIDKEGFLVRWWIGELNWQDGDGEVQLRRTIQELLDQ